MKFKLKISFNRAEVISQILNKLNSWCYSSSSKF